MYILIPLQKSITSWVTQFNLRNQPKIYNAICNVLRFGSNISAPILIFGNINPFRQKYLFEFIVNDLPAMHLSLLHSLSTMSHKDRQGAQKKKKLND